jgi:hypothetical protein
MTSLAHCLIQPAVGQLLPTLLLTVALAGCGGGVPLRTLSSPTAASGVDSARPRPSAAPATPLPAAAPIPAAIAALKPGEWLRLPNTKIRSVLPKPPQLGYAPNIIKAWSGGTVDQNRARLLVWGGGHADYWGNEMYALDLGTMSIQRIVDPSPATAQSACTSTLPDGAPASRHTYAGLTFITHRDRFFSSNGGIAVCGHEAFDVWTYDFAAGRWHLTAPRTMNTTALGIMAVYDEATRLVYIKDLVAFFSYSFDDNRYTRLNPERQVVDYHLSATIDSKRRLFVMLGDGVQVVDLASGRMHRIETFNAPDFVTSRQSPGVGYDAVADRIVAWHGGSGVYALDPQTRVWSRIDRNPGPTAAAPVQGTFGRWGYVAKYGVFALINDIDQDGWVFRASAAPPGSGGGSWVALASEGQAFSLNGPATVRFGAGHSWVEKPVDGAGRCDAGFFGADPAVGVVKACEVQSPSLPTPAPAPAPAPGPAPAPAPAPAPSLRLYSAIGGTAVPFTVGHAIRQGDVPIGAEVQADIVDFQAVVKNRWPDGSAKFAILSGRTDLPAAQWKTIALRAAPAPAPAAAPAPLTPAELAQRQVTATVQFGDFGTAGWSVADWAKPQQTIVTGPQMSAWTYRKPLGTDPSLSAWLEVRVYKGGAVEVLPWIENGTLMDPVTAHSGTATFTLGGTTRFSAPLNLLNHQRAVLAQGEGLSHWVGADPKVVPRHDTGYLMASRLVPHYFARTPADSALFGRLAVTHAPLARANFPQAMGTAGYDPSIGLLPEWDAAYLTSGGDPRAWRAVMVNGHAAGRYGLHFRDAATQRPPGPSAAPRLALGPGSGIVAIGGSSTNQRTPASTGAVPPAYQSSHHPSMGFMAYLLGGWNYHLEQLQFVATANHFKQSDVVRRGAQGILETTAGANTTRGAAWALRTLAQAAAMTPDGDPLRADLAASINANVDYYHSKYVARPGNPLGLVQPYSNYNAGADPLTSAVWMDDFFTAAFGYLKDLQVHDPALGSKLDAFLSWKYRSVVGRLGSGEPGTFPYTHAAQYTLHYAPANAADWVGGTGPWYADWGQVARAMSLPAAARSGDPLVSGYPTEATGYWGNLLPALAYAVDHGAPGALEAWDRLVSASNAGVQAAAYRDQPVWSVVPRPRPREQVVASSGRPFQR